MLREIAAAQALAEEALGRPFDDDEADRFRTAIRRANARRLAIPQDDQALSQPPPLILPGQGRTTAEVSRDADVLGLLLCLALAGCAIIAAAAWGQP